MHHSNTQGTTQEVKDFPGDTILVVDTPGLDAPDFNKPTSTAADALLNEVKASKASLVVLVTYWDALKTERSQKECKKQVCEFVDSRGFADAKIFYTDAAAAEQARCRKQTCRDVGFKSFIAAAAAVGLGLSAAKSANDERRSANESDNKKQSSEAAETACKAA